MTHRRSNWWRRLLGLAPSPRRSVELESSLGVLFRNDIHVTRSDAVLLDPGHPWRAIPCLICWSPIAAYPARIVGIFNPNIRSGAYWRIGTVGYIVHEECDLLGDEELYDLAHRRENPGCQCHTLSAAGRAAYSHPYPAKESML